MKYIERYVVTQCVELAIGTREWVDLIPYSKESGARAKYEELKARGFRVGIIRRTEGIITDSKPNQ